MSGILTLYLALASLAAVLDKATAETLPSQVVVGTGDIIGFGETEEEWRGEVIHLSWSPRAFLLKRFLSDKECDHLINKAKPMMEISTVVDSTTGQSEPSQDRTSTGTFFAKGGDEVIARIEKRVAQVSMIPVANQDGMQVLHYRDGQKYDPHFDYFHDAINTRPEYGGQRVATLLMYLSSVEEGGETVFPNAEAKVTGPEWSECARAGLAVKPVRGDALLFYSLTPDGAPDPASLHGSCPTTRGDKWAATKWIHVVPYPPSVKATF